MSGIVEIASNLWAAKQPLGGWLGELRTRMTVVRLTDGGMLLHSPVRLSADIRASLDVLGPVRWIIAPNRAHHLFVADYLTAFPHAKLFGAPGLPEKRKDLRFDGILGNDPEPAWAGEISQHLFQGAPYLNEIFFLHRPSRSVISTDIVLNIVQASGLRARLFCLISGTEGRFGPHRLVRMMISDH